MSRKCDLCGTYDFEVRPAVIRTPDGTYRAVARCTDHGACEDRLTRTGQPWPVARRKVG